jgi:hypothetical protein
MNTSTNNIPGCLSVIFRFLGIQQSSDVFISDSNPMPYRLRDDFLSPAEHSFYQVIRHMLAGKLIICPKVALADIFYVTQPDKNFSAYNRINRKHVDFLVCKPEDMRPVFGIELDDSSHNHIKRQERDQFVEQVFRTAELPLVRVPVQASYSTAELAGLFRKALQRSRPQTFEAETTTPKVETVNIPQQPAAPQAPVCPKCGIPMVLRTAQRGQQAGNSFYGCPNFPKCRCVIPVE